MMISVIVPTHNEEKRIRGTLLLLEDFLESQRTAYEILVVDDGSDGTAGIVSALAKKNKKIRLIRFAERQGKGGALMIGMREAKGDSVLYDADASTPPKEIPKLAAGLKKADVVVGSRRMPGSIAAGIPPQRIVTSAVFSLLVRILFNLGVNDTQCGFKAVSRRAAEKLLPLMKSKGFVWDVELIARAKKAGLKVLEVPIEWNYRAGGTVKAVDTLFMLRDLLALRRSLG